MKKFLYKRKVIDEGYDCCDIIVDCECHSHILRVLKYSDEESLSLMHYSCGLPENISEKTLCWDVIIDKGQALDLANSILDIYGKKEDTRDKD
jgi:hypothetical protein